MRGVSVVLPCLNEEKAIGQTIEQILKVFKNGGIKGEIIVVDNGSTDNSAEIAKKFDVRYVSEPRRGYGSAYLAGFEKARYDYLVLGDCDGTYDFSEIPKFLDFLDSGYDFVVGDRFKGDIEKGAMSFLHRYFGNPALSATLRLFFKAKISDAHSGFRAIKKDALEKLNLRTTGMEFASEMVVKAIKEKLKIKEVPINYYKRKGESNLRSFSDGWRHLRFMLMYAPDYLFFVPGFVIFLIGCVIMALFLSGSVELFGIVLYNRPMVLGSFLTILGYQIMGLGLYSKTYMKSMGFIKSDRLVDLIAHFIKFETGITLGLIILFVSFLIGSYVLLDWMTKGFPGLTGNTLLFALTLAIIGVQTMFSAFFLSVLLVEKR